MQPLSALRARTMAQVVADAQPTGQPRHTTMTSLPASRRTGRCSASGAYATKSVGANYGFLGGQVQYNLMDDAARGMAAAGRLSAVAVLGPVEIAFGS